MNTEMMLDRMSSIEKEPRTLSIDQIRNAREEALYVMKTKTVEEALRLFTQGLQPVPGIGDISDMGEQISFPAVQQFREIVTAPF